MSQSLYDQDFYAWTKEQASAVHNKSRTRSIRPHSKAAIHSRRRTRSASESEVIQEHRTVGHFGTGSQAGNS